MMLEIADMKEDNRIVDLGSGDGCVVLAAAKAGVMAEGYEYDEELVQASRKSIAQAGMQDRATIHKKSFWHEDLSRFDVVFIYGMKHVMPRLEKKLLQELKPGSKIVSNYFRFPNLVPDKQNGRVRLYQIT